MDLEVSFPALFHWYRNGGKPPDGFAVIVVVVAPKHTVAGFGEIATAKLLANLTVTESQKEVAPQLPITLPHTLYITVLGNNPVGVIVTVSQPPEQLR
jgi:hypothetical protein